jgi:hypothetical protein
MGVRITSGVLAAVIDGLQQSRMIGSPVVSVFWRRLVMIRASHPSGSGESSGSGPKSAGRMRRRCDATPCMFLSRFVLVAPNSRRYQRRRSYGIYERCRILRRV